MSGDDSDEIYDLRNDEDINNEEYLKKTYRGAMEMPELDMDFTKIDNKLWQAPEMPFYDDTDFGPRNLPRNAKCMSPLDLFLLLFPVWLLKLIVTQTNLYHVQSIVKDPTKKKRGC
jgi:hypothetical protein